MKKILYIVLAASIATTSCRRSEIQHDQQGGALQVEIERQAFEDPDSLSNPASKATETAFEPNDSIGIYVHTTAKLTATGNHTPNLSYATTNGTTWTAGGYLSDLPQAGTTYTATGYYPYDRLMIDPTAFVFTVRGNQTTPQAVAQSELMYAAPTAIATPTSAPKLTLSFKHLFTKITLKFAIPPAIDGAVVTAVDRVDLRGVYRAATVNLSDGTLTKPDNQGDVTMHLIAGDPTTVGSEVTYQAIAIPQTIKKGAFLAELSFATASGARKFTYRPDADEVWVSNLKRNLHLVSVGDLCFTSRLDLTDGLAHADLALKIKAPTGSWTLTSPAAWLTLSTTEGGTYGASISGTSTGAEQTIYVSATANTAASGVSWLPRSGVLTLTSGVLKTTYTATQNFYRFGMGAAAFDASAGQSTFAVAPFASNQEWKATGSGDWLKISPSAEFGAGEPKQEHTGGGSVGANGLFVHIDANNTAAARTGTVTFTPATAGGTASVTTIKQPVALCALNPQAVGVSKYVSSATPLFTVTVPKGVRWKLTSVVSGGVSDMSLSMVPAVGAEQVGTGEPQQVVGSYTELVGDAVRYSDVAVAWASYGADQQSTVRVTQNLEAVLVDNVWWATGNLVATGARGAAAKGGCAIGAPTDGGLYFQFGSLIGWKGGSLASAGKGQGMPDVAWNLKCWNGSAAWSWTNESMVWPSNMSPIPTVWPTNTTNQWYFGLQTGWSTAGQNIRDFPNLASGGLSNAGVGDPCSYYLGSEWRSPSTEEHPTIANNKGGYTTTGTIGRYTWAECKAIKTTTPIIGGYFVNMQLFSPAAGYRAGGKGSFDLIDYCGYGWSTSICSATESLYFEHYLTYITPECRNVRRNAFSVRCVADFVDTKSWTAPVAGAAKTVKVFVPKGQTWTAAVVKGGTGLTLSGGSGTGAGSFTITYAATSANSSRAGTIHVTSGSTTFVLKVGQTDQAVEVNGSWWATGNLVASSSTAGKYGVGGCKIGAPGDGGLYFQFGSLIGWKGGAQTNGGSGVGMPKAPLTTNGTYWNGSGYSWADDAMVWPTNLSGNPTAWPQATAGTAHQWFFSGQGETSGAVNVTDETKGVGDPCRHYLGGTWRLPTADEYKRMCNNLGEDYHVNIGWVASGGEWVADSGGYFASKQLFFPASGNLFHANGSFHNVTKMGLTWSSSVYTTEYGLHLGFSSSWVGPRDGSPRSQGFPVRCVMDL